MCAAIESHNGKIGHWKGFKGSNKAFHLSDILVKTCQYGSRLFSRDCPDLLWDAELGEVCSRVAYVSSSSIERSKFWCWIDVLTSKFRLKPFEPRVLVSNWPAHAMKESSVQCKMAVLFNAKDYSLDLGWNATSASVAAYAKGSTIEEARRSHFSTTRNAEGLKVNIGTSQVLINMTMIYHDQELNQSCYQHETVS